jgi:hypothetical protein
MLIYTYTPTHVSHVLAHVAAQSVPLQLQLRVQEAAAHFHIHHRIACTGMQVRFIAPPRNRRPIQRYAREDHWQHWPNEKAVKIRHRGPQHALHGDAAAERGHV